MKNKNETVTVLLLWPLTWFYNYLKGLLLLPVLSGIIDYRVDKKRMNENTKYTPRQTARKVTKNSFLFKYENKPL